jgi:autotransporter translocation and assembly factor TamB
MRTARSSGFILTMVIVFLGLMAVVLLVLTEGTQIMLWQTDRMYLAAVQSNLISSGAAWTSVQLSAGNTALSDREIELDAKSFSNRPCAVSVRLMSRTDSEAQIHIATSCSKARWTLTRARNYAIPLR